MARLRLLIRSSPGLTISHASGAGSPEAERFAQARSRTRSTSLLMPVAFSLIDWASM